MRHSSGIIKTSKTCRLYDVIKVAEKFDFTAPPRFKVSSKYDLILLLYRLHRLQFIQQLLRRDYASPNIFSLLQFIFGGKIIGKMLAGGKTILSRPQPRGWVSLPLHKKGIITESSQSRKRAQGRKLYA